MSELFRSEALKDRRTLLGDVSLAVPLTTSWLIAVALLFLGILASFLIFGSVNRRVTALGWLRPAGAITRIYARSDWLVDAVFVREGSIVSSGAPLLQASDLSAISQDTRAQAEVLQAIGDEQTSIGVKLASARRQLQLETASAISDRSSKLDELKQLDREIALQGIRGRVAKQTLADGLKLDERGYISRLQLHQYEDAALDTQQKSVALGQRRTALAAQIEMLQREPAKLNVQYLSGTSDLQQRAAQLRERRAQVEAAQRFILRAPREGRIADVQVRPGEISKRNQFQLAIIPRNEPIIGELFVPSSGIGLLRRGQTVHLRYDAYPYQQYGYGVGVVDSISTTSLPSNELPIQMDNSDPVYRVVLKMARADRSNAKLNLRSGMTLRADILIEREPLWRAFLPSTGQK